MFLLGNAFFWAGRMVKPALGFSVKRMDTWSLHRVVATDRRLNQASRTHTVRWTFLVAASTLDARCPISGVLLYHAARGCVAWPRVAWWMVFPQVPQVPGLGPGNPRAPPTSALALGSMSPFWLVEEVGGRKNRWVFLCSTLHTPITPKPTANLTTPPKDEDWPD